VENEGLKEKTIQERACYLFVHDSEGANKLDSHGHDAAGLEGLTNQLTKHKHRIIDRIVHKNRAVVGTGANMDDRCRSLAEVSQGGDLSFQKRKFSRTCALRIHNIDWR